MGRGNCSGVNCLCNVTAGGFLTVVGNGAPATPFNVDYPTATIEGIPVPGVPVFVFTDDNDAPIELDANEKVVLETTIRVPIPGVAYNVRVDWDAEAIQSLVPAGEWRYRLDIGGVSQAQQTSTYLQNLAAAFESRGESMLAAQVTPTSCVIPIRVFAEADAPLIFGSKLIRQQLAVRVWWGDPGAAPCMPFTADTTAYTADITTLTADRTCI